MSLIVILWFSRHYYHIQIEVPSWSDCIINHFWEKNHRGVYAKNNFLQKYGINCVSHPCEWFNILLPFRNYYENGVYLSLEKIFGLKIQKRNKSLIEDYVVNIRVSKNYKCCDMGLYTLRQQRWFGGIESQTYALIVEGRSSNLGVVVCCGRWYLVSSIFKSCEIYSCGLKWLP